MSLRTVALAAFILALAAYLYLLFMLTIAPASILYSKPPEPQAPFTYFLRLMWKHELAMVVTGSSVVVYAIHLFRRCRDWRSFAVLVIGVPLLFAVFQVFGL